MKRACIAAWATLFASLVSAQSPADFYGNWKATWQGTRGSVEAKVELSREGGSWRTLASNPGDRCVGFKMPVALDPVSDTEAVLTLKGSEVLAGCRDYILRMTLTSRRTAVAKGGAASIEMTKD